MCYRDQKFLSKRTVGAHLMRDQDRQVAAASSPDIVSFLQLRIEETSKVIRGGPSMPDLVSGSERSHQLDSEGAPFGHFEVIDIC
jgi:hypothetical protein